MTDETARLRYIRAANVESGGCRLGGFAVLDRENQSVGELSGLVVDPSARRIEYLVVTRKGWLGSRSEIVPFQPACLDRTHTALRVTTSAEQESAAREFDPSVYRPFSDDDLVTALFSEARLP